MIGNTKEQLLLPSAKDTAFQFSKRKGLLPFEVVPAKLLWSTSSNKGDFIWKSSKGAVILSTSWQITQTSFTHLFIIYTHIKQVDTWQGAQV